MLTGRLIMKIEKLKLPIIGATDGYHSRFSNMKRIARQYIITNKFMSIDLTTAVD